MNRFGIIFTFALLFGTLSCGRPAEENKVYTAGKDVHAPQVVAQPLPAYTEEARKAHAEGTVLLQCIVRKNGSVDDIKVVRKMGYGLDESAVNTIATQWRFKPGTLKGVPVDVQANIEVSFKMY